LTATVRFALVIAIVLAMTSTDAAAQSLYVNDEGKSGSSTLAVPFGFFNEIFGGAIGGVYGVGGFPQPQASLLAAGFVGTTGSAMGALIGQNIRVPLFDRLFVDPVFQLAYFRDAAAFFDGNPNFVGQRAGTNDSNKDNFVLGDGLDNFARVKFKYIVPIGNASKSPISTYQLDRGIPVETHASPYSLNPFSSGKTELGVRLFYRSQAIKGDDVDATVRTNGIDGIFAWDNRDFAPNPTNGHKLRFRLSRDFGGFNSSNSWTAWQVEVDRYFSLGSSSAHRQLILAFDFWTADTPSWKVDAMGNITNRPPTYTGSTLGGLFKMRGYPQQRFSDKAAIYYASELRWTLPWNPFDSSPFLQRHIGVRWIQVVPFIELGRVAPEWNLSELHSDLKLDGGIGIRVWAKGIVVRVDVAVSDEDFGVQMIIGQPFQF